MRAFKRQGFGLWDRKGASQLQFTFSMESLCQRGALGPGQCPQRTAIPSVHAPALSRGGLHVPRPEPGLIPPRGTEHCTQDEPPIQTKGSSQPEEKKTQLNCREQEGRHSPPPCFLKTQATQSCYLNQKKPCLCESVIKMCN